MSTEKVVGLTIRGGARAVLTLVSVLFAVMYGLSYLAGGASSVPPHGFYIPLMILGVRFGGLAVVAGAAVATVLAGPALPAVVADDVPQRTSDWAFRGVFFCLITAGTTSLARAAVRQEHERYNVALRESELRSGLGAGQFELHYQPVVRLDSGGVVGAEALVRWRHPEYGVVGPDHFIPFAEQTGVIDQLGVWVLRQTVEDLRQWQLDLGDDRLPVGYVSVNASRSQFRPDGLLVPEVDALGESGPLPAQLMIEVTETGFVEDQAGLIGRLVQLQLRGVKIAMDDYGTGQSTLIGVRDIPLDAIKLDRSFVVGVDHAPTTRSLVANTIDLAQRMGKQVVVEGVETAAQRDALLELGVLYAQGYLFSPPLTIDEFREFATTNALPADRGENRHRILVVDDQPGDHLFLSQLLADWGAMTFAHSGPEALELASVEEFTLVLLDIQMPGMSGYATATALHEIFDARYQGRDQPLIVGLSARDLLEDEQAATDAGMDAFLTKPLRLEQLAQMLSSRTTEFAQPMDEG